MVLFSCKKIKSPFINPLQVIAELPPSINESSGLANASDSSFWTHNDSGNSPTVFEISKTTGDLIQSIKIDGLKNVDWEELASDSLFIYIGDMGNNNGSRKNLVIYKIDKSELTPGDTVHPASIQFYYPEQKKFITRDQHNFDCEAMIAYGDSLYLFTKNRGDLGTDVYRLPKVPGSYPALHINHFNTGGLVTGADILPGDQNRMVLVCYKIHGMRFESYLWWFTGFKGVDFFNANKVRVPLARDLQSEAVLIDSDSTAVITNEEEGGAVGRLSRVVLPK